MKEILANYIISLYNQYLKKEKSHRCIKIDHRFILTNKGLIPNIIHENNITSAITINYLDNQIDDSKSTCSTSSSSTLNSMDNNYCDNRRSSITLLSDILCDHYVNSYYQQHQTTEIPLETYKLFEALHSHPQYNFDDDDESWFIWDNFDKQKDWIQVREDQEIRMDSITIEKARNFRINSDHLRMIVAEVNMIRENKIMFPLKSRVSLPPRNDFFKPNSPSPLSR